MMSWFHHTLNTRSKGKR